MRLNILYFPVILLALSACSRSVIFPDPKTEGSEEGYLVIRSGFENTRVSHFDQDGYYKSSWEKGDTITVIAGDEFWYYVADNSGAESTFSLSDEHSEGLKAWPGQEVRALSGKVSVKDKNYALIKESMGNQHYNPNHPPLDIQTCTANVLDGSVNLVFSYPCAYLRMKVKKQEIVSAQGRLIINVQGDSPFVLNAVEDYVYPPKFVAEMQGQGINELSEDNWAINSSSFPGVILNITKNQYISWYGNRFNCYIPVPSIFYHFAPEDLTSFGDNDDVSFSVAIPSTDKLTFLTVSTDTDKESVLYEKTVPDCEILQGHLYEVNLERPYHSSDFSMDGIVYTLQTASVGKGIDVVLMGEGYTDREMDPGERYESDMDLACEELFRYEPYASYRNRFNVYAVKVVSPTKDYKLEIDSINQYFEAIPSVKDGVERVIILNRYPSETPQETSYCLLFESGTDFIIRLNHPIAFERVLMHEFSHGMAKLGDEYYPWVPEKKPITDEGIQELQRHHSKGWMMNLDITDDPELVVWNHLMKDERFADEGLHLYIGNPDMAGKNEGLDIFEGGGGDFTEGIYRPSYYSVMNDNITGIWHEWMNAPSREALYKFVMQASEGESWVYDYETFVAFDKSYRDLVKATRLQDPIPVSVPSGNQGNRMHVPPIYCEKSIKDHPITHKGILDIVRERTQDISQDNRLNLQQKK